MRILVLASFILLALSQGALAGDTRVALVVGVANYRHAAVLSNTRNDASDIGAALQRLGFKVQLVLDPDRSALETAVRHFGDAARGVEAAVFFYAGHALEVGGRNWLLPTNVTLKSPRDLRFEALDIDGLLEQTDGAARVTLLFLDACRDNPFQRRLSTGFRDIARGGLSQVSAGAGTLIAFATAPGTVARDGKGRNSPFTAALLRHIEKPGLEVRQMLGLVRRDVREISNGTQLPWENAALEGEFYFKNKTAPVVLGDNRQTVQSNDADVIFWQSIKDSKNAVDFQDYIARFPSGTFADLARRRVAALSPTQPETSKSADSGAQRDAQASFATELATRIRALVPSLPAGIVAERVANYVRDKDNKAQAISYQPFGTWRTIGRDSRAAAAQKVLEGCQAYHGQPCALVAVGSILEPLPADGTDPPRRDMPRVHYNGLFDPEQIPAALAPSDQPSDLRAYRGAKAPKAAAYHPRGRVFTVTAASSQHDAEARALAACNDDPARKGADGPCYLYAVGDQVVFPRREIGPITSAGAIETQTLKSRMLAWFTAATPDLASSDREGRVRVYAEAAGHKAQAVAPLTRSTWYAKDRSSSLTAEEGALEACQVRSGQPCVLVAVDDTVSPLPTDRTWPRRDMLRVRYAGRFDLERVPNLVDSQRRRPAVAGYGNAPAPKAAAYHPWGRLFVATGMESESEAEARALADCNADSDRAGRDGPCFVYARGDQVVLPDRRTNPAPR